MSDRLSPRREAEIAARIEAAPKGPWRVEEDRHSLNRHVVSDDGAVDINFGYVGYPTQAHAEFVAHSREDVRLLLAELAAVRAERDEARTELAKYVGAEPTIAEEMAYLSECLTAVHDLCNRAQAQAERWEHPLPVPEWVEQVRGAASGMRSNDPADNRHRIYIDGRGNGWISVCSDEGTEWVVPVQPAAHVEQDVRDIADETGSLREIGRCW